MGHAGFLKRHGTILDVNCYKFISSSYLFSHSHGMHDCSKSYKHLDRPDDFVAAQPSNPDLEIALQV